MPDDSSSLSPNIKILLSGITTEIETKMKADLVSALVSEDLEAAEAWFRRMEDFNMISIVVAGGLGGSSAKGRELVRVD